MRSLFFVFALLALWCGQATAASVTMGDTTVEPGPDSGNANLLVAQQATLAQLATIQSLSFYVVTASGNLVLGVYDSTGPSGGPGHLVAQTAGFATATGWNTKPTTTNPQMGAGTYWLAYLPKNNALVFRKQNNSGACDFLGLAYTTTLP